VLLQHAFGPITMMMRRMTYRRHRRRTGKWRWDSLARSRRRGAFRPRTRSRSACCRREATVDHQHRRTLAQAKSRDWSVSVTSLLTSRSQDSFLRPPCELANKYVCLDAPSW